MKLKSAATTAEAYLAALPADRREAITTVRALVNRKLPKGYRESIGMGMIVWSVPLDVCPDTYNGQPLMVAALASQKQYMSVYLMTLYGHAEGERRFRAAFAQAGKKLDMGKCCVRFRRLEDLHLPAIGEAVAAFGVQEYVERALRVHSPEARAARREARAAGTTTTGTPCAPAAKAPQRKSARPAARATAAKARPAKPRSAKQGAAKQRSAKPRAAR
jgi:hypothetical protein